MFVIGDILKGLFGEAGLVGSVTGVLKDTGIIKDPEMELKVKQALMDYELKVKDNGTKLEEMYLKDVADARDMQKEALKQDDKFAKRFVYYLAALVIGSVFLFDTLMFFVNYPENNRDMINQVSGILNATALVMVLSFFFGSSHSSAAKTDIIAGLEKRK